MALDPHSPSKTSCFPFNRHVSGPFPKHTLEIGEMAPKSLAKLKFPVYTSVGNTERDISPRFRTRYKNPSSRKDVHFCSLFKGA